MKRKVLLGLTTTPGSNWKEKTKEIVKYNIKEISLFPTFIPVDDRKKLYRLLETTPLKKIPHVHLRDDAEPWEVRYLIKRFKTEVFNIHSKEKDLYFVKQNKIFRNKLFVENPERLEESFFKLAKLTGGVCFDVSHYYEFGVLRREKTYRGFLRFLKKTKVGCCHISAMTDKPHKKKDFPLFYKTQKYSDHHLNKLSELNYVKKYVPYLPEFVSIELENSFKEQLEIKKYLEKILS